MLCRLVPLLLLLELCRPALQCNPDPWTLGAAQNAQCQALSDQTPGAQVRCGGTGLG